MYFHAGKIVIYLSVKTLWVRGVQVEVLRVTSSMCYECAVQIYLDTFGQIKCDAEVESLLLMGPFRPSSTNGVHLKTHIFITILSQCHEN